LNSKNHKKDRKKKNLLAVYSSNQVESSSDVDENNFFTCVEGGESEYPSSPRRGDDQALPYQDLGQEYQDRCYV
jgi:hypothetical protein